VPGTAAKKQVKYKKPPDAPKRFKSAYIFFSIAKHPEIREQMEKDGSTEKTTNVAKLVSEAWRNLNAQERAVWEEKARKDKARYEVEKSMYTGPWKVSSKKLAKKDAAAPRRPMSAFLAFSNATRAQVKQRHPGMANIEVTKILAQMWKDSPDSARSSFIDREAGLRKEYLVAISEWRATVAAQESDERQKREQIAMDMADKMEAQGDKDFSTFAARYSHGGSGDGSSPTDLMISNINPPNMPLLFPPARNTQNNVLLDASTQQNLNVNVDPTRTFGGVHVPPTHTATQPSNMSQNQNLYDSYNIPASSYGAPSNHNDMLQSAASNMLQGNLYSNTQYTRGVADPNLFGGQQQQGGTSIQLAPQSMQEFTALNNNRTPSFYPDQQQQQQQQIMMMQSLSNNNNNSVGQIMDSYAGAPMYGGGGGGNNNLQMQQHLQLQQMAAMNRGMGGGGGSANNNSLKSDQFFKKN